MIPPREDLEPYYEPAELEVIDRIRKSTDKIQDKEKRTTIGRQLLRKLWREELEFIEKTTWIAPKETEGSLVLLKLNYAQRRFYEDAIQLCRKEARLVRVIILKARQLGFSTFIQAFFHFLAEEHAHRQNMTISYKDTSTLELFQKGKLMRNRMWFPLSTQRDRDGLLHYSEPHGSVRYTCTAGDPNAGRSMTFQDLHCSELPMWPDAETTCRSAHQCVPKHRGTHIFHESTAQGAQGLFYDMWQSAEDGESSYVPFFAPWFWNPQYDFEFPSDDHEKQFMRTLPPEEKTYGVRFNLKAGQLKWRELTIKDELNGSRLRFREEYPACAEEAFLTSGHPVFAPEAVRDLDVQCRPPIWVGDVFLDRKAGHVRA